MEYEIRVTTNFISITWKSCNDIYGGRKGEHLPCSIWYARYFDE